MAKKTVKKKTEPKSIIIPMSLARLLAATKEDMKNPSKYEDIRETARCMLALLIEALKKK